MRRISILVALVGTLALANGVSFAGDFCISFPGTPSFVLVGKGFAIPGKGKCKAWVGFSPQFSNNFPSIGTGCTSSDGTDLNFNITTSFAGDGGGIENEAITLSLPSLSGADDFTFVTTSGSTGGGNGIATNMAKCSGNTIPAAVAASANHAGSRPGLAH